jgi:hypothetical protein
MTNEWDPLADFNFLERLSSLKATSVATDGEDDLLYEALPFTSTRSSGTSATVSGTATSSPELAEASREPTASCTDANISITLATLSESTGATYSKGQDVLSSSEGT